MRRRRPTAKIWQGFSNTPDSATALSWLLTPGLRLANNDDFKYSRADANERVGKEWYGWSLVQYVVPPLAVTKHAHDPYGDANFDHVHLSVQASAMDCTSVRFDNFCVCRTTPDKGPWWCCGTPPAGYPDSTAGQCPPQKYINRGPGLCEADDELGGRDPDPLVKHNTTLAECRHFCDCLPACRAFDYDAQIGADKPGFPGLPPRACQLRFGDDSRAAGWFCNLALCRDLCQQRRCVTPGTLLMQDAPVCCL